MGEHLLDVLAGEGIAAYLQPSADLNPILRATTLPGRPTDRLYVDRAHLAAARVTLNRLTGGVSPIPPAATRNDDRIDAGGSQRDIDAEWARIIAGFHSAADPTSDTPWPAAEGIDATRAPDTKPDPTRPATGLPSAADFSGVSLNRRRTDNPAPLDGLEEFMDEAVDAEDEDDERYVPPPPPPLPHISKYATSGIIGIILGFVLFLRPSLLPIDRDLVTLIGFSAIIAGAITLVWRLRSGDDDDDFDDGAVV